VSKETGTKLPKLGHGERVRCHLDMNEVWALHLSREISQGMVRVLCWYLSRTRA